MSIIKKHKKPMALISVLVLIVSLTVVLVANVAADDTKLPQVEQPQWDGNKITWTQVEHPELNFYSVSLYKDGDFGLSLAQAGAHASQSEHDFSSVLDNHKPGIFNVTVRAMANPGFTDGDESIPSLDKIVPVELGTVGQPQWSDAPGEEWTITWSDLPGDPPDYGDHVWRYYVMLEKEGHDSTVATLSVTPGNEGLDVSLYTTGAQSAGSGNYYVRIMAVADGDDPLYLNGGISENSPIRVLGGPPLPVVDSLDWHATEPGVITWDDNPDAEGYHVRLYDNSNHDVVFEDDEVAAGTTSYDLLEEMRSAGAGEYYASIKALGDGDNFADSEWFETADTKEIIKLDPPAGLTFEAPGVASWDPVPNNSGYTANLQAPGDIYYQETPAGESQNFSTQIRNLDQEGDYYVEVRAMGTGYYLTSDFATSDPLTFERLITPTSVVISDTVPAGIVTWDNNDVNAEEHRIFIYRNGSDFSQTTDPDILSTIRNGAITAGGTAEFYVTVRAYADTDTLYLDSELSDQSAPVTVQPLDTPSGLNWDGHTIKWENVTGAVDYRVELYCGDDFVQGYTADNGDVGVDCSGDIASNGSGFYTATVRADADPDSLYLNSGVAESDVLGVFDQLDQVAQPGLSSAGVATWTDVSDALEYAVRLYDNDDTLVESVIVGAGVESYNYLAEMRSAGVGTYYVTVQALATGLPLFVDGPESVGSVTQEVTQLATPVVTFSEEGVVSFEQGAGAIAWNYTLNYQGVPVDSDGANWTTSGSPVNRDMLWLMDSLGQYQAVVVESAPGTLYLDSEPGTATQNVVQLSQVSQPELGLDGVATWTNVAGADFGYLVELYMNGNLIDDEVAPDGVTGVDFYDTITGEGFGEYAVRVTALGNSYLVWEGIPSEFSDQVYHGELGQVARPAWNPAYEGPGYQIEWTPVAGAAQQRVTLHRIIADTVEEVCSYDVPGAHIAMQYEGYMDDMGYYFVTVQSLGLIGDGPVSEASNLFAISGSLGEPDGFAPLDDNGNGIDEDDMPFEPTHAVMGYIPSVDAIVFLFGQEAFGGIMDMDRFPSLDLGAPSGRSPAGTFFEITLDGMPGVFMLLLFEYGDLPAEMIADSLLFFRYGSGGWEVLPTEVDTDAGNIITIIEEFSDFGLFGEIAEDPPTQPTPPTVGLLPFMLIPALLMILVGAFWAIRRRNYSQQ